MTIHDQPNTRLTDRRLALARVGCLTLFALMFGALQTFGQSEPRGLEIFFAKNHAGPNSPQRLERRRRHVFGRRLTESLVEHGYFTLQPI